ncbi:esterase-like activity of phytase family protein [Paraburkholderia sp. LEh10]|uniref:esterase-like activity of phytase family protein n=1 Tax=Paraburkholderia sp. LEh10 TaxID=2821353 RepID=UPI0028AAE097|nr:esterase-like activity of phytase family protein [Paraburkholderia sp. LEh10]
MLRPLSPVGNDEISMNKSGRVANKGMEGLAITPDGTTLYGAMQSPLIQDGGTHGQFTRIVKIDIRTGRTTQYAYPLTNIGTTDKPKYPTISDVLAINDHELLVDERDGKGLGDNSTASFKQISRIDLTGAQDVSQASGDTGLKPYAVKKTLFLDVVAVLQAHGYTANDIPAKIEGIAFGPDVTVRGVQKRTLFVANDNDFPATVTDSNHPSGIANPNQFFVLAIDLADLPDYVAQRLQRMSKTGREHDDVCGRDDDDQDRDHDHDHDGHGH